MLKTDKVTIRFGGLVAVNQVSVHIRRGQITGLIGPNGAGKTTTLQTISGLTPKQGISGDIVFMGKKIQGLKGNKISRMGILHVLEGRHVFSKLSVEENLQMGAYMRRDTAKISEDIVASLNSYATDFNDANVINNVIQLVEANFNVSKDASGRAMAGLSGGSRLTLRLANSYPDMFNYYCVMAGEVTRADSIISGKSTWYVSGKMSPSELFELRLDAEKLVDARFHITMGLYETRLHGMHEMEQALSEKGIEYTQALYAGGHDWFVWRDCFVDYVSDLL